MKDRTQPILTFTTVHDLEACLSSEPADSRGFWLKVSRIGAPETTIGKAAAIEAALCYGWIDGQLGKLDDDYFLIRMTPRRPGSRWSANNCATAERLALDGRLRPAGLAQVEAAKKDGRWAAAYVSQGKAEIPRDLEAALAADEAAKRFFETLDRANRFAVIYRVNDAKRPETRARRIAQYVAMLARGETIHPSRKPTKAAT